MTHPMLSWLNSCLDADEAIANEVSGRHEEHPGPGVWVHDDDYRHDSLMVTKRAVLADVAAKRLILAEHPPVETFSGGPDCWRCWDHIEPKRWPCDTIRILASAYRHRTDYDPAWAPT